MDLGNNRLSPVSTRPVSASNAKKIRELTDFKRKAKGHAVDRNFLVSAAAARSQGNANDSTAKDANGNASQNKSGANTSKASTMNASSQFVLSDLYKLDSSSVYVQLKEAFNQHKQTQRETSHSMNMAAALRKKQSLVGSHLTDVNTSYGGANDDGMTMVGEKTRATNTTRDLTGEGEGGGAALIKIGDNYYNLDAPPTATAGGGGNGGVGVSPSRPVPALGGRPGQVITSRLASLPLQPLDRPVVTLHPNIRRENPNYFLFSKPVAGMRNDEPVMLSGATSGPAMDALATASAGGGNAEAVSKDPTAAAAIAPPQTFLTSTSEGDATGGALNFIRIVRDVAARQEALIREQSSNTSLSHPHNHNISAMNATTTTTMSSSHTHPHNDSNSSNINSPPPPHHAIDARYAAELMRARATDEMFPSTDVCRNWREGRIGKHILNWNPPEGTTTRDDSTFNKNLSANAINNKRAEERLARDKKNRIDGGGGGGSVAKQWDEHDDDDEDADNDNDGGMDLHLRSFLSPLEEARLIAEVADSEVAPVTTTATPPASPAIASVSPPSGSGGRGQQQGRRSTASSGGVATPPAINLNIVSLPLPERPRGPTDLPVATPATTNGFHAVSLQMRNETDEPPPSPDGSFLELLTEAVGLEEQMREQFTTIVSAEQERMAEDNRIRTIKQLMARSGKDSTHLMTLDMQNDLEVEQTFNALATTAADDARAQWLLEREERERNLKILQQEEEENQKRRSLINVQKMTAFRASVCMPEGGGGGFNNRSSRDSGVGGGSFSGGLNPLAFSDSGTMTMGSPQGPTSPLSHSQRDNHMTTTTTSRGYFVGDGSGGELFGEASSTNLSSPSSARAQQQAKRRRSSISVPKAIQRRTVSFGDESAAASPKGMLLPATPPMAAATTTPRPDHHVVRTNNGENASSEKSLLTFAPAIDPSGEEEGDNLPVVVAHATSKTESVTAASGGVVAALTPIPNPLHQGVVKPPNMIAARHGGASPPLSGSMLGDDATSNNNPNSNESTLKQRGTLTTMTAAHFEASAAAATSPSPIRRLSITAQKNNNNINRQNIMSPPLNGSASPHSILSPSSTTAGGVGGLSARIGTATAADLAAAAALLRSDHPQMAAINNSSISASDVVVSKDRREYFRSIALTRREIETLWGGAMTACGVMRFALVDAEAMKKRPPKRRQVGEGGDATNAFGGEWETESDEEDYAMPDPAMEASIRRRSSSILASVVASARNLSPLRNEDKNSVGGATKSGSQLTFTPSKAFPFAKAAEVAQPRASSAAADAALLRTINGSLTRHPPHGSEVLPVVGGVGGGNPSSPSSTGEALLYNQNHRTPDAAATALGHSNTRTALEATLPKAFAGKSGTWLRRVYFPLIYAQMLHQGKSLFGNDFFDSDDDEKTPAGSAGSTKAFSDDFATTTRRSNSPNRQGNVANTGGTAKSPSPNKATAEQNPKKNERGFSKKIPPYVKLINANGLKNYLHQVKFVASYDPIVAAAARNAGKLLYVPCPTNPGDTSQSSESEDDEVTLERAASNGTWSPRSNSFKDGQDSKSPTSKAAANEHGYKPPTSRKQKLRNLIKDRRGMTSILADEDRFGIERARKMEGKTSGSHSAKAVAKKIRRDQRRGFKSSIETVFDFDDVFQVAEELLGEVGLTLAAKPVVATNNIANRSNSFGGINVTDSNDSMLEKNQKTNTQPRPFSSFTAGNAPQNDDGSAFLSNAFGSDGGFLADATHVNSLTSPPRTEKLSRAEEKRIIATEKEKTATRNRMAMDSLLHIIYHHNQQQLQRSSKGLGGAVRRRATDPNPYLFANHTSSTIAVVAEDVPIDEVPQSKFQASIWKDMNRKRRQKNVSDRRERSGKEVFTERDEEGDLIDYNQNQRERHRQRLAELCASGALPQDADRSRSGGGGDDRSPADGDPLHLTHFERDIIFNQLPLDEATVTTYFAPPRRGMEDRESMLHHGGGGGMRGGNASSAGGGGVISSGGGGDNGRGGGASLAQRELEALSLRFVRDEIEEEVWHGYSEGQNAKVMAKRQALSKLDDWSQLQMRLNRRLVVPNQMREAQRQEQFQKEMAARSGEATTTQQQQQQGSASGRGGFSPSRKQSPPQQQHRESVAVIFNDSDVNNQPANTVREQNRLQSRRSSLATNSVHFDKASSSHDTNDRNPTAGKGYRTAGSRCCDGTDSSHSQGGPGPSSILQPSSSAFRGGGNCTSPTRNDKSPARSQSNSRSQSPSRRQAAESDESFATVPFIVDGSGNTQITAKEEARYVTALTANNFTPQRRLGQHYRDRATLSDRQYVTKMLQDDRQRVQSISGTLNTSTVPSSSHDGKNTLTTNAINTSIANAVVSAARPTSGARPLTTAQRLAASLPNESDVPKPKVLGKAEMAALLEETAPPPSILYKVSDEYRTEVNDVRTVHSKARQYEKRQRMMSGGGGGEMSGAAMLMMSSSPLHQGHIKHGAVKRSFIPPRPASVTQMRARTDAMDTAYTPLKQVLADPIINKNANQFQTATASMSKRSTFSPSQRPQSAGPKLSSTAPSHASSSSAAAMTQQYYNAFKQQQLRPTATQVAIAGKMFSYDPHFSHRGSVVDGD